MSVSAEAMALDSLGLLHRRAIDGSREIRALLTQLARERTPLGNGIDGRINERSARVEAVEDDRVRLSVQNVDTVKQPQLYLVFESRGKRYFFAADVIGTTHGGLIEVAMPPAIHEAERRSLPREAVAASFGVKLASGDEETFGRLLDRSQEGIGLAIPSEANLAIGASVELSSGRGRECLPGGHGVIRNSELRGAWRRIGLSVSTVPYGQRIPIEYRKQIVDEGFKDRLQRNLQIYGATLGAATSRLTRTLGIDVGAGQVEILRYSNDSDRELVAIADRVGVAHGGLAIVIAPAWGRTKETMMPLAAVLAETFAAANKPVVILRFDGTNRRGESWIDPKYRSPGSEYLGFRFSQAVRDIHSTVKLAVTHESIRAKKVILVTTSLASVEGRRAVATDRTGAIGGWVSLVGMVDLHSGLRAASGGVDYAFGLTRGLKFGRHELAGVVADMDLTGRDVLEHDLGLFEDARRDMAKINVPVSWIHGRHDGWIEIDRVQELMSAGPIMDRRLIEVPTGHQLRSSKQALETFQLVAQEVGRLVYGRALPPVVPRGRLLAAKQAAERARRPAVREGLRDFWKTYVLGRDGRLGFEILSSTSAYQEFMGEQIRRLAITPGALVADLGSGVGDFAMAIKRTSSSIPGRITAVDLLPEALKRGQERLRDEIPCDSVAVDLARGVVPLVSASFDCVLASLLVSYVTRPERLLAEARRILKPGGRIVVSCPQRDADLSKVYVDGIRELTPGKVRRLFGADGERDFARLQRDLLNQGARLLSLEEEGSFSFWDESELAKMVECAGFEQVVSTSSFGHPPQVSLVSGVRT